MIVAVSKVMIMLLVILVIGLRVWAVSKLRIRKVFGLMLKVGYLVLAGGPDSQPEQARA